MTEHNDLMHPRLSIGYGTLTQLDTDKLVTTGRCGLLIIGNFLCALGASRGVCEDLADRLTASGWRVFTASRKRCKLYRLSDMVLTAFQHRRDYAAAQVDVYSGLSFVWAELVCCLLKLLGKPFVLTLHGGNLPCFAKHWSGRVRHLLNSANAVTTPSRYLQHELSAYRSDLQLLPNAIDISLYPFCLRLNPQPRLVWLRAFHEIYNPTMAVRVVASLLDQKKTRGQRLAISGPVPAASNSDVRCLTSDLRLTMFGPDKGDGSLRRLKAEVRKRNLVECVSLPGAVGKSEVPRALSDGDIFLNTTNVDNTPVSVIEAMACGLCIVSTNVGGIPYLVEDGRNGLLVPPNDAPAMAATVRRILTEPGLAEHLSRNARAKAERFDWSVILPQWEKLLMEVAYGSARGEGQRGEGRAERA